MSQNSDESGVPEVLVVERRTVHLDLVRVHALGSDDASDADRLHGQLERRRVADQLQRDIRSPSVPARPLR